MWLAQQRPASWPPAAATSAPLARNLSVTTEGQGGGGSMIEGGEVACSAVMVLWLPAVAAARALLAPCVYGGDFVCSIC